MYIALTVFIVIVAILLIGLVLIQNSKGGGLAAGFASGNQVMGAPRTADFLEKATWILAAVIVLTGILAVGVNKGQSAAEAETSAITEQVEEAAAELPQAAVQEAEAAE